MSAADSFVPLDVPELGPSLGRLVTPRTGEARPSWIALDDVRFAFVTALFELAGEARQWSDAADRDLALAALSRGAWLAAWEEALAAVSSRAIEEIATRLDAAATESRMPARVVDRFKLTPAERSGLAARLGRGALPLMDALDALEASVAAVRAPAISTSDLDAWRRAVLTAARRTEAAWLALEEGLAEEWREWSSEVELVRSWHRPMWPVWVAAATLLLLATGLGLVLGGYVDAPSFLLPLADAWWRHF
ncbi:MAG: hypothetical protein ABJD11_06235 [Gemmatimonadota bacterium]